MSQPTRIETGEQLFVEGADERNFFEALVKRIPDCSPQIWSYDGRDNLGNFLEYFGDLPGVESVERIGLVRDADDSAASAFQSVQSALAKAGLPHPSRPGELAAGPPIVGVWIMPDGKNPGMLETLLWESVGDPALRGCVEDFLRCAEAAGQSIARPDKARAHAFVATRRRPEVSVGVAAQEGYWDFDHPAFDGLRAFLETVAGPED